MNNRNNQPRPLPYRDQCIENRHEEIWIDIPGLESYYSISNHGRVMRLKRYSLDRLGRKFTISQKIILPAINRSPNILKNDYTYRFQVKLQLKRKVYSIQVQRMVYHCFVESFDLNDRRINIIAKEGNGLNILPKNLIKVSLEEKVQRSFSSGRQLSTLEYNPEYKVHAALASAAITGKQVSRYNLDGLKVNTYDTQIQAAKETGTTYGKIINAIKCEWLSPNGFYWRLGKAEGIQLVKRPKKDYRATRGKPVTKFDLNGKPIGVYQALSEAAMDNKISHKCISLNIRGLTTHAGGFMWKLGDHHDYEKGNG